MTYSDIVRHHTHGLHPALVDVLLVIAGSIIIALSAQASFYLLGHPMVPVTGQTFGVLLVGAMLGSRRGPLSVLVYLGQGAVGLPVFAGAGGGLSVLLGPTAGYLIGFVPAAAAVGFLAERGWDRGLHTTLLAMLIGNAIIYIVGVLWLSLSVGFDSALTHGMYPFLLGDSLKIALASVVLPTGWLFINVGSDQ